MTDAEKMRAGFAQLVRACDALQGIVGRAELDPITVNGRDLDGCDRRVTVAPSDTRDIFETVIRTLREACEQGAKMGLPVVEEVRRSPIIIPSQEFRP